MSYKLGVSNIFELLEDETDEHKGLKAPQAQSLAVKEEKKPQQKPAQKNAAAPNKPVGDKNKGVNENKGRQPEGKANNAEGGNKLEKKAAPGPVAGGGNQPVSLRKDNRNANEKRDRNVEGNREKRDSNKGGNGVPTTAAGGFQQRPGKRTFDRKSGTGRGKESKKGGSGKGNWGTALDGAPESQEQVKPEGEEVPTGEVKPADNKEKVENPNPENKVEVKQEIPAEERDEDENKITLDEYMKKQEEKSVKISLPSSRKAGEGEDLSKWKGYIPLKREADDEDEEEEDEKVDAKREKKGTKKTIRVDEVLSIKQDAPKRRGGRDGRDGREGRDGRDRPDRPDRPSRGGYRGGGGVGGGNGGRRPARPLVIDENNFPALATKN